MIIVYKNQKTPRKAFFIVPPRLHVIYVCLGVERVEPRIKTWRLVFDQPLMFLLHIYTVPHPQGAKSARDHVSKVESALRWCLLNSFR